jgi:hypothetical protein
VLEGGKAGNQTDIEKIRRIPKVTTEGWSGKQA